jgi:hypothetical protein
MQIAFKVFRGLERIRTAVEAFAELCLATRPRDQLICWQNYKKQMVLQRIEKRKGDPLQITFLLKNNYSPLGPDIFSFNALNASISPNVDFSDC